MPCETTTTVRTMPSSPARHTKPLKSSRLPSWGWCGSGGAGGRLLRGGVLLLGHLDTVVAHGAHKPLTREGGKLVGSGSVDMKGGDVLALGVLRSLAQRPELYGDGRAGERVVAELAALA